MKERIRNPILPGFNPDPSILRVEDNYYIATSTFEWFPGVQIYHSKDLKNWQLITRPLNRLSQLDMKGNPSSGGVWAPCLSYHKGLFYLVYTDVKNVYGKFKDTHNYLVTSTDIKGEWSDPIYLNSSGFDPSLFHDTDGRKWLVNMQTDHRPGKNPFSGIILQQFSEKEQALIGPVYSIFEGTELGCTEGPHLYKRNNYYYLMLAEGGTGLNHAVTLARSKDLLGPYEVSPTNPLLTSKDDPLNPLQKAGHGSLVKTQTNEWYMVHLCARHIPRKGRCILGRETAIQKVVWTHEDWLQLEGGGTSPQLEVLGPDLPCQPVAAKKQKDDFDSTTLDISFQSLRVPLDGKSLSLIERPGYLRLKGGESLSSKHTQSLVARRQESFSYSAVTCLEFDPDCFQQMAGLVCFYDVENYYYLNISYDETLGKCLNIMSSVNNDFSGSQVNLISIQGWVECFLKVKVYYDQLQFYYSANGRQWEKIGPEYDASTLSDEHCREGWFTGAFVGLACQDLSGQKKHADFDYFEYIPGKQK